MSHVVIGGTFDHMHKGHEKLMRKAFKIGTRVLVCITSDGMVKGKPMSDKIESYETRRAGVVAMLWENGWQNKAEVKKIDDPFTLGLRPMLTHIVVSSDTRPNAEKLNKMRKKKGFAPLKIVQIAFALAKDGKPISDARIRKGEIDKNGKML